MPLSLMHLAAWHWPLHTYWRAFDKGGGRPRGIADNRRNVKMALKSEIMHILFLVA